MSVGIQHVRMCRKGHDYIIVGAWKDEITELRRHLNIGRFIRWKKIPVYDWNSIGIDINSDELRYRGGGYNYATFENTKTHKTFDIRLPKIKRRKVKVLYQKTMEWNSSCMLWKTDWYHDQYIGLAPLALTTKAEIWDFAKKYMSVQGKMLAKEILATFVEGTDYVTWA